MKKKNITERENYLRALEFRNPEWIPITLEFSAALWQKHGKKLEEIINRHSLISGNQQRGIQMYEESDPICVEGAIYEDDWGCIWHNVQGGIWGRVLKHPLSDWKSFNHFKAPDPSEQFDWKSIKTKIKSQKQNGLLTIGGEPERFEQTGFLDRLVFLRGFENLLMDFLEEPPQLYKLIEIVFEYNMLFYKKWLEMEVDVVLHHGDLGSQKGLIFSPHIFRKYLKPRYMELFQMCRKSGSHVWYSSDGNILEIIDDLIECGVSMHDPQVRANTIDGIASFYKDKICALVDIDEQMLPFCNPDEIDQQIKDVVDCIGSPKGGLMIFAIPSKDVPLNNIEAIILAWEKYCFNNYK